MKLSSILVFLIGLVALPGMAFADKVEPSTSLDALVSGQVTSSTIVPLVIDNYGFEVAEGFALGFLDGQSGWTVFAASAAVPFIDNSNPSLGAQHMRMVDDPGVSNGTSVGGFSPNLGAQPTTEISDVSVDVFISNTGGADYDVIGQAPSVGFLTWRVKFLYTGPIRVLDDTGSGLEFTDTGATWPANTYFNLRVVTDPVANTIDYYLDGVLIYSSVAGVFSAAAIEQVVIFNDNWQMIGEFADFDNLLIDTAVAQDADLAIAVVDNAVPPLVVGDQFVYSLTATNNGPADATGVTVVNTLSANVGYVSDTCTAAVAAGVVTWSIGNLANTAVATCDITVQVNGYDAINNLASISGNETDPVPANDNASLAINGVIRGVPSLSWYGFLALIFGLLFVVRRQIYN